MNLYMTWRVIKMVDKGTNEWDGDEGVESDDYEPDYDAVNDRKKLEEEEEQDEYVCCRGDCK
jgi:hypothetical protein